MSHESVRQVLSPLVVARREPDTDDGPRYSFVHNNVRLLVDRRSVCQDARVAIAIEPDVYELIMRGHSRSWQMDQFMIASIVILRVNRNDPVPRPTDLLWFVRFAPAPERLHLLPLSFVKRLDAGLRAHTNMRGANVEPRFHKCTSQRDARTLSTFAAAAGNQTWRVSVEGGKWSIATHARFAKPLRTFAVACVTLGYHISARRLTTPEQQPFIDAWMHIVVPHVIGARPYEWRP
jgi:hypothetical protein